MTQSLSLLATLLLATTYGSAVCGDESVDFSDVEKSVRQAFPKTPITSIRQTPIEGLVEIVAGKNVLYADPTGRYLVLAHLSPPNAQISLKSLIIGWA